MFHAKATCDCPARLPRPLDKTSPQLRKSSRFDGCIQLGEEEGP